MKKAKIREEQRRAVCTKVELTLLHTGTDPRGLPEDDRGAAMAYALLFVPEEQRKQAIERAYEHLTNYEWELVEAVEPSLALLRKPSDSVVPTVRWVSESAA